MSAKLDAEGKPLLDAEGKEIEDDTTPASSRDEGEQDPAAQFETWLATQPEETRKQFADHVTGLKSALVSERNLNKDGKAALRKLKTFEDAETLRQQKELTDAQKNKLAADNAIAEAKQLKADLLTERINNVVLAEAGKLNFADPQDAIVFIKRESLEIDDDGKVDPGSVVTALKVLLKAKPHLAKKVANGNEDDLDAGARGKGGKLPDTVRPHIRL